MKKQILLILFISVFITCEEFREVVFVDTDSATNITSNSATLNGLIVDPGEGISECGHVWWKSGNESITTKIALTDKKTGSYACNLTGLDPATVYFAKAYATDGNVLAYGEIISFTTLEGQQTTGLPVITTVAISAVTTTTAICGGNVTEDGGSAITARGVCWSTNQNPTTANNKTNDETGTGSFTSSLTGLSPNTTYYLKAYATNSLGTSYGIQLTFTTLTETTEPLCEIPEGTDAAFYRLPDGISITIDGIEESAWNEVPAQSINKNFNGETPTVTAYWKGLWDSENVYILLNVQDDDHWPSWESGGLNWEYDKPEIYFDVNEYLEDGYGVEDGIAGHWQMGPMFEAGADGMLIFDNGAAALYPQNYCSFMLDGENYIFEYQVPLSTMPDNNNQILGTDIDMESRIIGFDVYIIDQDEGKTSVRGRKVWQNDATTGMMEESWANMDECGHAIFCGEQSGTVTLPSVTTNPVTAITQTSAKGWGIVVDDGGSPVTSRGICWSTNPVPTITDFSVSDGSGTGTFSCDITGLLPNTTYYARAYAMNSMGTKYGDDVLFTTAESFSTFTDDRDGTVYTSVKIGEQVWMAENLAYLPAVSLPSIQSYTKPYYYVYDYTGSNIIDAKATSNYSDYGVLYNWPAAMNGASSSISVPSGVQGVCPSGWHLPSYSEFYTLIEYAGGDATAGAMLKEAGTAHWQEPNVGATNSLGFTALPGGLLLIDSEFYSFFNKGTIGYWWATSEFVAEGYEDYVELLGLDTETDAAISYIAPKNWAHSVRCIKD